MLTRTVSGIIGAILVVCVLIFNQSVPIVINLLIAAVCVLSIAEIFSAMGITKKHVITIPSFVFVSMIPLFSSVMNPYFILYAYTFVMFSVMVIKNDVVKFHEVSMVYTMSVIIPFFLNSLIMLRDYDKQYGTFYIILALGLSWMTDTGGYFFGSFFGKKKLAAKISPKKTVEGALGGIVTASISLLIIYYIYKTAVFGENFEVNILNLMILGILGSIVSIFGDLIFSIIKRSCNIKDFGNVIPGHGGILDRIDSVIFAAPFVYLFIVNFPILK